MPHANNLDLAIYPAMSKHHSALLREHSNTVVSNKKIWNTANIVWNNLPSCQIARGFILATRIMKRVITEKGSNSFLQKSGGLHNSVREDFLETETGVRNKKNKN